MNVGWISVRLRVAFVQLLDDAADGRLVLGRQAQAAQHGVGGSRVCNSSGATPAFCRMPSSMGRRWKGATRLIWWPW